MPLVSAEKHFLLTSVSFNNQIDLPYNPITIALYKRIN